MERLIGRLVGVAVGALVGLIIRLVALKKLNSNGKIKTEYDERQNEIRGKGYKWGFWTEAAYMMILMLLDVAEIKIPAASIVIYFIGIVLGVMAMCVYCIWNGAYFGINNDTKKWTIFFIVFGAFNLVLSYMMYIEGELIEDGMLMPGFVNLLCGVMLIAVVLITFIKKLFDSKENMSDEES